MERYVIVKIARPTDAQYDAWKKLEGMTKLDRGQIRTGPPFEGEITVHVAANAYTLEIVARILRTACVNFSLHEGKEVRTRKRKVVTSTASTLSMVELMSELQPTPTDASDSTIAEQSNRQPGDSGPLSSE